MTLSRPLKSMFFSFLLLVFALPATSATLSLVPSQSMAQPGDAFTVNINVDDATGLTGATFTLTYPSAALDLGSTPVASAFFQTVTDSRTGADPSSIVPWQANTTTAGQILLAGAYIDTDPDTGGGGAYTGPQTLFTLSFQVKAGAGTQSLPFVLQQTQLCNGPAGWGTDVNNNGQYDPGDTYEAAPILIKAYGKGTPEWDTPELTDDFEVLLAEFSPNPTTSVLVDTDSDSDGLPDSIENGGCTEVDDDDTDDDGLLDGDEDANHDGIWDVGTETNPCDADTDGDGMDDGWETQYIPDGLDPLVGDADEDPDEDGYTNIQEYRGKSDPGDPDSKPFNMVPVIQLLLD